jgi:hypothetical protein
VGNIENALIQQNNIRWINQKAMEGVNRPKLEPKLTIEYAGLPIEVPYFDTGRGRKSSVTPILVAQSFDFAEGSVTVDSDDSGVFHELPPLLQSCLALLNNHSSTPLECYSCSNYSHSPYLKCAVNPTRTIDQDCNKFERASKLVDSDWDGNEDNPANYPDWENSENNPANYHEY